MKKKQTFREKILKELTDYVTKQEKRFNEDEVLTIDLHCHDYNSNVPDELLGRILRVPETWLRSEDLLETLKSHGCDTFTITNHNNARSCYEVRDRGIDILTCAEFSCTVPDYRRGIHVLTYGFTPRQEEELDKLRSNLYKFMEYAAEHDIPTIWAHPLYHHHGNNMLPMEFFDKMALLFERFEVINGQRDSWQNMLVKNWVESLTPERIDALARRLKIPPDRYCRNPYRKSMSGGSDSHMGIFSGLSGTRLHVPDLKERLNIQTRSMLALEAIKKGNMAPYGAHNESEKMTITFLDYFCQIGLNIEDPGLLRMLLHKGDTREKLLAFAIANGFFELKRHRLTMNFLKLFHDCFSGKVPRYTKRFLVPKAYKEIFHKASEMAAIRRDSPDRAVETFDKSITFMFEKLNQLLVKRLKGKLDRLSEDNDFSSIKANELLEELEIPSHLRNLFEEKGRGKRSKELSGIHRLNLPDFLDGLSFPILASSVILGASFTSTKVLYNARPLLDRFSRQLGTLQHPHRILWLTDTFEDVNGVAMVLRAMHEEIKERDLAIDILVCSDKLESDDHLIVVPPLMEFTLPFYEQQPFRIPNVLDIHRIFRDGEYDRIICSTEWPMGLIALYLKHAYSVPAHFYVHTDWMMFARKVLDLDQHNLDRLRRLLRAFYRGFDSLFVLNSDQYRWFQSSAMGFDQSKVFLTAHWAEKFFKPQKAKKSSFGINNNAPVLLFAGRVSEEKGVMELPALYKKIKAVHPDTRLVIAGSGPAEKKLKKALPEAIYLGWVDHRTLPEIYSAADMLLLPSKFDTFGCVVLEALSCGLPVTAYNTKGPKDIIIDGVNGYLVRSPSEMADAILTFLKESKLRKSFRQAALRRAKKYSADRIMDQFLKDLNYYNSQNIPTAQSA